MSYMEILDKICKLSNKEKKKANEFINRHENCGLISGEKIFRVFLIAFKLKQKKDGEIRYEDSSVIMECGNCHEVDNLSLFEREKNKKK